MIILGINAYHGDSSACIVKEGELIAAAEEERFRRIKHWAGFPQLAIEYCLAELNIDLSKVDHIAINRNPKANLWKKLSFTLRKRPDVHLLLARLKNAKDWLSLEEQLQQSFPNQSFQGQIHHIEHHFAHLASAFYVSNFSQAVVVSVDGFGDFASMAWGIGHQTKITVDDKIYFPHSLGIFYQALTQYLGFSNYGDEYKVMGLAPYGELTVMAEMQEIVSLEANGHFRLNLDYFRHHKEKVDYEWENGLPKVGRLWTDKLEQLLGGARKPEQALTQRHYDIARSVQAMYEKAFFHLLNALYQQYPLPNLCLAGGCAMNSVANGKIYQNTPFKHAYIQSAAGDAGGAIGAAFEVWHQNAVNTQRFFMEHAYWGNEFRHQQIQTVIAKQQSVLAQEQCSVELIEDVAVLTTTVAKAIATRKVVGWFQGRMEWGPRALGNRSIVCDPRVANMKDILNQKIKRRESFRPFAPSILREHTADWFETDDNVPFMMKVFQIKADKQAQIPAVTHVDGSGRLQTVFAHTNPLYYQLIQAFYQLTAVPMVLNTSFNENEPVVCTPEQALATFLRTKMDVLVLGSYLLKRQA